MTTLGLCLIVRDEERFLRACVDSARAVVDEVVVVDTGSLDGTLALAEEIADQVVGFPFDDDFSSARNAALDKANTDWVLFLDADERLVPAQAARIRPMLSDSPPDVLAYSMLRFNLFATGEFYTGYQTRLIRQNQGVRYERRINESVKGSVRRLGGTVERAPLYFNHFGHCRPVAERDAKAERYMRLMRRQLEENPDDPVLAGYVALNLRMVGRFAEARTWSDRSVADGSGNATVWFFRGHVLRALGDPDGALEAFAEADRIAPDAATSNMVGVMHLSRVEPALARAACARSLEHDPLMLPAKINLGLAYQADGEWDRAAGLFAEVADENPAFLVDDWDGRCEVDCFRSLYNETVFRFAGLGYHLAYCERNGRDPLPRIVSRETTRDRSGEGALHG
jgi:tetratricopeptide (TPR) repeat protein